MSELAVKPGAHRALCRLRAKNRVERNQNGKLLTLAVENGFDVFITGDRNLSFQQNVTDFAIAIVVLESAGIQLQHTLPLMPKVIALLPTLQSGTVVRVTP